MLDTNPTLIQPGAAGQTSRTPLVLIHDGSGLISSYFWLGPLGRKVFGISNPRFESGGKWEGGLGEMATTYKSLIKSVIPRGKVLIGGWSLGGLLSLDIARRLAQDADIAVVGLILIDAVYPKTTVGNPENLYASYVSALDGTNTALQLKVQQANKHARQMIRDWYPPSWRTRTLTNQSSRSNVLAEEAAGAAQDDVSDSSTLSAEHRSLPSSPPPAILLKASQYVPIQDASDEGKLAIVDVCRETKRLGWEEYEHNFIRVVFDINGHHFNVFAEDKVQQLTTKISMACAMLDARC